MQECNGIQRIHEIGYLQSIIYAAERSVIAFNRFDQAVAESDSPANIFAEIQEALMHASALSRFFWTGREKGVGSALALARGRRLQKMFMLDEASSLRDRSLRNALEHFDERLDQFLLNDPRGMLHLSPIVADQIIAEDKIVHIFKLVDPHNGVCVIFGQKFEFEPIRQEVERIRFRATELFNSCGMALTFD